MSQNEEINQTEAVAVTLVASALVERCHEMIVRLTDPETIANEIADFRASAMRHVTDAVLRLSIEGEADARQLAREHIDDICADWFGFQPRTADKGSPSIN